MQINRLLVAGAAQQGQDALTFSEHVDPDEVAALGKQNDRMQQLVDFLVVGRVSENRQPKRRLGDEEIAINRLERWAGRVWSALVVAGNHYPAAAIIEHDLSAAQHVAGRHQPYLDLADC